MPRGGRGVGAGGILLCLVVLARGAGALDCNVNGAADDLDVAGATSLDCQGNGVPDECELFPLSYQASATVLGTTPIALDVDGSLGPFVAVASLSDDRVDVFTDAGDGSLAPFASPPVGGRPEDVLLGTLLGGVVLLGEAPELVTANASDGTVSVLASGLSGYSDVTGSPFAVGGSPTGLAAADLTEDGDLDILVTDRMAGALHVLVNDGAGSWSVGAAFATGANPRPVVAGDFDGDGDQDALVGARTPGEVVLFENDAGISFLPAAVAYAVGDPLGLAAADVNADGTLDLAVLSVTEQAVHVLSNDGSASFSLLATVPVGVQPVDVEFVDLDGNGTPDLLVPCAGDDAVTLALNEGAGVFGAPVNVPSGDGTVAAGALDLDRDGRMDLVTAEVSGETLTLLRALGGDPDCEGGGVPDACELAADDCDASGVRDACEAAGGRGFGAPVETAASLPISSAVAGGDFDADGHGDAVVAAGDGVTLFRGRPDSALEEDASFATGMGARGVAAVDVDADGDLDLVVANRDDDTVSVLRGDGAGAIAASSLHDVTPNPQALAVGDLDRDGDLDIAVRGASTEFVTVLIQDAGGFDFGSTVTLGDAGNGLRIGDVDGDGHADLLALLATLGASSIQVVRNEGGGTLTPQPPILATSASELIGGFGAGDLTGDGRVDLVLSVIDLGTGVSRLRVALNDGAGSYSVSQTLPLGQAMLGGASIALLSGELEVFDADADGDADVVLPGAAAARVLRNDGAGTLALAQSHAAGAPFLDLAPSDVNGDGALDLVMPTPGVGVTALPSLALPAEAVCFGVCLTVPAESCIELERARLTISEKKAGKEKWKLSLEAPLGPVPAGFFGDPASGSTRVDVCLYDDVGALVGELGVGRGGDVCGPRAKPCWKAKGGSGFAYKDPVGASSGVRKIKANSRSSTDAKLSFQAANKASKGETSLPVAVAAALESAASARVQVLTTDGACFDATLLDVRRADGAAFEARAP